MDDPGVDAEPVPDEVSIGTQVLWNDIGALVAAAVLGSLFMAVAFGYGWQALAVVVIAVIVFVVLAVVLAPFAKQHEGVIRHNDDDR